MSILDRVVNNPQMQEAVKKENEFKEDLIENQNETIKGIATTYALLVEVAKKLQVEIPKPLVNMEITEDDLK